MSIISIKRVLIPERGQDINIPSPGGEIVIKPSIVILSIN